jgi:hypothetical protein
LEGEYRLPVSAGAAAETGRLYTNDGSFDRDKNMAPKKNTKDWIELPNRVVC